MTVDLSLLIYLFTNAHQNHQHTTPNTKSPITAPIYRHALSAKPIGREMARAINIESANPIIIRPNHLQLLKQRLIIRA